MGLLAKALLLEKREPGRFIETRVDFSAAFSPYCGEVCVGCEPWLCRAPGERVGPAPGHLKHFFWLKILV